MSDSDSDLDFESADEDSEFAPDAKNNTNACSDKILETEVEVRDGNTPEKDSICDEKMPNVTTEMSYEISNNDVIQPITESKSTEKERSIKSEITISETSKSLKNIESLETTPNYPSASIENVETDPKPQETSKHPSSLEKKFESNVAESSPKQRIPLRLEKKRQERQEEKEHSPVPEQKSDLINILQDSNNEKFSSWGFSRWGTTLLSTAASSVSSFSNQVSQGIGTVLESVESTLGAPSPEELAIALNEKKAKENAVSDENVTGKSNESQNKNESTSSLLFDVSSWTTKVLENTGSKVLMGGLGTLELIGKKSMDILTVGDPGLRKKRSAFGDGCNLSEILREAKAKADERDSSCSEDSVTVHYSQVFDDKQGLVHLEALEMLSRQSQAKLQRLTMRHSKNQEIKIRLEEIRSICENIPSLDDSTDCESFEDFESIFKKHALDLSLPLKFDAIIRTQRKINDILCEYESAADELEESLKEVYESAICCLAEFTAKCIETFHKVAELILVKPPLSNEMESCATNLTGLTTVMCIETNNFSTRFHKHLDKMSENQTVTKDQQEDVNAFVTNLYVEAENSNKYIQDAYQMLIPVLQECLLENLD